jgi:hypothetical protein
MRFRPVEMIASSDGGWPSLTNGLNLSMAVGDISYLSYCAKVAGAVCRGQEGQGVHGLKQACL